MTEASFAKQFLASLDARPIKLSSDYVADPRQLPAQPAYVLPRNAKPYTKRAPTSTTAAPGTTVTLKTIRPTANTPTSLTLAAQPLQSSIFDLKALIARRTGFAPDKVKVLWEKRPVSDSKTIGEVVGAGAEGMVAVEMGVMYVGAPTAAPVSAEEEEEAEVRPVPNADAAALDAADVKDTGIAGGRAGPDAAGDGPVARGKSGWDVCEMDEFWDDLWSFVTQRVRDEEVAARLVGGFRKTWEASRNASLGME